MAKSKRLVSRKQRRKEERKMKKTRKHEMYMKKHCKKVLLEEAKPEKIIPPPTTVKNPKKQNTTIKKGKSVNPDDVRKKRLKEENDREDRNIRALEKKMKMNRRKKKKLPKSFIDDGLAWLLEACDPETVKNLDTEKEFLEKGNYKDDLENEVNDKIQSEKKYDKVIKKVKWEDEEDTNFGSDDDAIGDINSDEETDEDTDDDSDQSGSEDENSKDDSFKEDIYGRTVDKKGNVVQSNTGKYVPPAKRCVAPSDAVILLRRRINGCLNKLAENNMKSISNEIEELYQNNSRNDMNESLTSIVMSSIVQPILTPERQVQEFAMLISLLHAHIGAEVGAHFLELLAVKFEELYSTEIHSDDKTIHNVLMFLSHLYNFKIVQSTLMIDILNRLSERFNPLDLEIILLLLKTIGFVLRKDDPTTLRDLVLKLKCKAQDSLTNSNAEHESRVRFMLETLMAIKNNNMNKIPNYDPSHMEHLRSKLREFKRKGCNVVQHNISLEDLLKAKTKGRWWIVGSSWNGNLLNTKEENKAEETNSGESVKGDLLRKARELGMSTAIRQEIFSRLTKGDIIECSEKLIKLGVQQAREIGHVIIRCCLMEKPYNQFYALVGSKLCTADRRYQMALQCALRDQFKELSRRKKGQLNNIAQFTTYLLTSQSLRLIILQDIHFSEIAEIFSVRWFVRKLLVDVLQHENFENVFRLKFTPKLNMFREQLRVFIKVFILDKINELDVKLDLEEVKERIHVADKMLMATDSLIQM